MLYVSPCRNANCGCVGVNRKRKPWFLFAYAYFSRMLYSSSRSGLSSGVFYHHLNRFDVNVMRQICFLYNSRLFVCLLVSSYHLRVHVCVLVQYVYSVCVQRMCTVCHYCIFLCWISHWRQPKKVETCGRFNNCLYIIVSNFSSVVEIYILTRLTARNMENVKFAIRNIT